MLEVHRKLDRILENQAVISRNQVTIVRWLEFISNKENAIMSNVNQLAQVQADFAAEVAKQTTVTQSVLTLIDGLKTQLAAAIANAKQDQPALDLSGFQAIHDQLAKNDAALATAVAQNTVAQPIALTPEAANNNPNPAPVTPPTTTNTP